MQSINDLSQEDFEKIAALVCAERDRIKASKEVTVMDQIGESAFLEQLAEECSELSQAALKLARKMRDENPTPKTYQECRDSLQEEMADVLLCIDQYMNEQESDFTVWVYEIKKQKLERWKQRLNEMKSKG